jgi:CHAT domain-containing protein
MEKFYRNLLLSFEDTPLTIVEALRSAQKFVMNLGGVLQHPFYWAPFVLVGSWK